MNTPSLTSFVGKRCLINGKKMRIMLLDDHPVVTLGVAAMLRCQSDMQVLACSERLVDLLAQSELASCDVLVVDFHLPEERRDGASMLKRLRADYPQLLIVVYSAAGAECEYAAWRAGANAYLNKRHEPAHLPELIRAARAYPKSFLTFASGELRLRSFDQAAPGLSLSETEVLRHLAAGLGVVQVAARLHRSKQTISSHKRSAMHKLQLADDLALALYLKNHFPCG